MSFLCLSIIIIKTETETPTKIICVFSSNSNMEFLSTWKNLNLYAFIRWAGVNPDSYLKERKKRIETKKKGSKVDNKNSFKRQATVIFIKFLIDSK